MVTVLGECIYLVLFLRNLLKLKLWHFSWVTFWVSVWKSNPLFFLQPSGLPRVGILLHNKSNMPSEHMALEYHVTSNSSFCLILVQLISFFDREIQCGSLKVLYGKD